MKSLDDSNFVSRVESKLRNYFMHRMCVLFSCIFLYLANVGHSYGNERFPLFPFTLISNTVD